MKKNLFLSASAMALLILPSLWEGTGVGLAQNFSFNTTGAVNSSISMVEILQLSTTANSRGLYISHSGGVGAGNTGYGIWAQKTGGAGAGTNVAGYFSASGGANNYGIIVPSGGGNVGIGTSTPSAPLDVTSTGTIGIRYIKTGAADARITLGDPTQNWSWATGWAAGGDFSLIEEGTSGNRIYVQRTTGNVGIGTSTPAQKFHVIGTTRISTLVSGVNGAVITSNTNGDLSINNFSGSASNILLGNNTWGTLAGLGGVSSACATANYVPKMTSATAMSCSQIFDNGTNVGVGTAVPGYKLHVTGDIYANGGWFRVSGNQGLYWESWGPGWYCSDGTWLRTYNNASIWANTGTIATNGSFSGGYGGTAGPAGGAIFSSNVGIGTSSPLSKVHIVGTPEVDAWDNQYTSGYRAGGYGARRLIGGAHGWTSSRLYINGFNDWTSGVSVGSFEGGYASELYVNGRTGVKTNTPDDDLDVVGTAQVSSYLKVGNPSTPSTNPSGAWTTLYNISFDAGVIGFGTSTVCGAGSGNSWWIVFVGNYQVLRYDNGGQRARSNLFTPWIWIPNGATNVFFEAQFGCDLEDGWDGVFLEYTTNGSTWTKITSFQYGAYPDNAAGSNTACSGNDDQSAWNGSMGSNLFLRTNSIPVSSTWLQLRFVGMEDASVGTGTFDLRGVALGCVLPSVGGAFAAGNIYAQNSVYAGSNVLIGDLAEYVDVIGKSLPGDLICLSGQSNLYQVSQSQYDTKVIGVHSSNPTLTINNPNGVPVSLAGRVKVNVCGQNGVVKIGDYLTVSSISGHAMRADRSCFVVGKALEDFEGKGTGSILCFVQPGWFSPENISAQSIGEGSFYIPAGKKETVVYDDAITPSSKIFLTFRNPAGSDFWIQDIKEGEFSLNIRKEASYSLPFDYLVYNAKAQLSFPAHDLSSEKSSEVKKEKINSSEPVVTAVPENYRALPVYTGEVPPSVPVTPSKCWIWDPISGFVEYKSPATGGNEKRE